MSGACSRIGISSRSFWVPRKPKIGQLRRKIEAEPEDPKIILTEPGMGYRVAEPS